MKFWKKKPFAPLLDFDSTQERISVPSNLHPTLAKLVSEGWMAEAITHDGRPFIVNGVQYYEFIRSGEKMTYSRHLAYEGALSEYNEISGHAALLKSHLEASSRLSLEAFNYRMTEPERSEIALQSLMGLNTLTKKAVETKHPLSFICQVAAIYFVAANEDPEINDATLQEEKHAGFLKATEFHDFFLKMRIVPLNVFQVLSDMNLMLSTAQAYREIGETAKIMFSAIESDSTDEELKNTYRRLAAMSIDTINSYEHLFTRLSSGLTTSESMETEKQS